MYMQHASGKINEVQYTMSFGRNLGAALLDVKVCTGSRIQLNNKIKIAINKVFITFNRYGTFISR